jgi:hypothetical protein
MTLILLLPGNIQNMEILLIILNDINNYCNIFLYIF